MVGSSMLSTRSSGAPNFFSTLRIRSQQNLLVPAVRGWGLKMIASRQMIASIALIKGVASGLVQGMIAPTTPTGFTIRVRPFSGHSSTTPTVFAFSKSRMVPRILLFILATLDSYLPMRDSRAAISAIVSAYFTPIHPMCRTISRRASWSVNCSSNCFCAARARSIRPAITSLSFSVISLMVLPPK